MKPYPSKEFYLSISKDFNKFVESENANEKHLIKDQILFKLNLISGYNSEKTQLRLKMQMEIDSYFEKTKTDFIDDVEVFLPYLKAMFPNL